MYSQTDLSISYHGTSDLFSSADLPSAKGTFSSKVKAKAVGSDQGTPLVRLSQNSSQGKVQDVRGSVVAHDRPTPSLERERGWLFVR